MDSFYSQIAQEVNDESDETVHSKSNNSISKSYRVQQDTGGDIDDLLDEFDFASVTKMPTSQNQFDTDFDSVKVHGNDAKPVDSTSSSFGSSSFSPVVVVPPPLTQTVQPKVGKSKKNILDSLLTLEADPIDGLGESDDYDLKLDLHKNNNKPSNALDAAFAGFGGTKTVSRRSVRFSESLDANLGESGSSVEVKSTARSDQIGETFSSARDNTAPTSIVRASWDAEDSLNWPPRRSRKTMDFKSSIQRVAGNITSDDDLNKRLPSKNNDDFDATLIMGSASAEMIKTKEHRQGPSHHRSASNPSVPSAIFASNACPPFSVSTPKSAADDWHVTEAEKQRVKTLEAEMEGLRGLLVMTKEYHREEIKLLENSHECKIQLLEENAKRREKHLKEELEFGVSQCRERIGQLEQYHDMMRSDLTTSLVAAKSDANRMLDALRLEHSVELDALSERNAQALAKMKQAEQFEARALAEVEPVGSRLRELLDGLLSATAELHRSETERKSAAETRLAGIERKEDNLRQAEERIRLRDKESEKVHQGLAEEVTKLEVQLREQGKQLTDDRWLLKQEHSRLTKLQVSLEEDRRSVLEQAGRERAEMQQLMTNFFSEHRDMQSRLSTERNAIREAHQKLHADQLCWRKRQEEEETKINQMKADFEAAKNAFQLERDGLDERVHQIRVNEVKLGETQRHLDIIRIDLLTKETTLAERKSELDRGEEELAKRTGTLVGNQAAVSEIDARCRRLQEEQARIHAEQAARSKDLDDLERKLGDEKSDLAKRDEDLERKLKADRKLVCCRCKQPVKKVSLNGRKQQSSDEEVYLTPQSSNGNTYWAGARSSNVQRAALDAQPEAVKLVEDLSHQFTRGRMLEQLRQELAKDNDTLNDERIYLNGLQHSPYAV